MECSDHLGVLFIRQTHVLHLIFFFLNCCDLKVFVPDLCFFLNSLIYLFFSQSGIYLLLTEPDLTRVNEAETYNQKE